MFYNGSHIKAFHKFTKLRLQNYPGKEGECGLRNEQKAVQKRQGEAKTKGGVGIFRNREVSRSTQ